MKTNLVGGLQSKRVLQVTELTFGTSCNSTHLTVINLFFLKKKAYSSTESGNISLFPVLKLS